MTVGENKTFSLIIIRKTNSLTVVACCCQEKQWYIPRGQIFTYVCGSKCKHAFLCARRILQSITTLCAIHGKCSVQSYFFTWIPTLTSTHTKTPESGALMRPVETLLNCQSTLSSLTRGRQHQWLLFLNSGSLPNCIRWEEKSGVQWAPDWGRWRIKMVRLT